MFDPNQEKRLILLWRSSPSRFNVATGLIIGDRSHQEDALVSDFPFGSDCGLGVLADGMGGHAAGDTASALVVGAVFADLKLRFGSLVQRHRQIPGVLRAAATRANTAIQSHVAANPDARGMGSTLISTVFVGPYLYWLSIGDSPLYLLRDGALVRLNENHSMAHHIDFMVAAGQMTAESGMLHPDRNRLTSAVAGQKIARVDCPETPLTLETGDIVIASSDGVHSLDDASICRIAWKNRKRPADEIAMELLNAVTSGRQPDQDNTSLMVARVLSDKPLAQAEPGFAVPGVHKAKTGEALEAFDAVAIDEVPVPESKKRAVGL